MIPRPVASLSSGFRYLLIELQIGHLCVFVALVSLLSVAVLSDALVQYQLFWIRLGLIDGICVMCAFARLEIWLWTDAGRDAWQGGRISNNLAKLMFGRLVLFCAIGNEISIQYNIH